MNSNSIYLRCAEFERLAYFTLDKKQAREIAKNLNYIVNHISKNYLTSPQQGQRIFNEIAKVNAGHPTPTGLQFKRDLEKFKIHLEYYNEKNLPQRKQERDLILKNINTLLEAKDFRKYFQATPSINTAPVDMELDGPSPGNPLGGYDMGF